MRFAGLSSSPLGLCAGLCWIVIFSLGLMVGVSLGFFALTVRERDGWPCWFQSFATTFSGASFLSGQWWLASHGKGWQPVFISFGPGFSVHGTVFLHQAASCCKNLGFVDGGIE